MFLLLLFTVVGCDSDHIDHDLSDDNIEDVDVVEKLLSAARDNEITTIQKLSAEIETDEINQVLIEVLLRWHQYTPYVDKGDLNLVKTLMELGADPNTHERGGEQALYLARTAEMLSVLLDNPKADIHLRSANGATLLIAAIAQNNIEKVQLLLQRGVDPNERAVWISEKTINLETIPLFLAIQYDETEGFQIVKALIETEGIDLEIKNEAGLTPLQFAESLNRIEIYEMFKVGNAS